MLVLLRAVALALAVAVVAVAAFLVIFFAALLERKW